MYQNSLPVMQGLLNGIFTTLSRLIFNQELQGRRLPLGFLAKFDWTGPHLFTSQSCLLTLPVRRNCEENLPRRRYAG